MNTNTVRLALVVAATISPALARAQHETHQMGAAQAPSAELVQCIRVQPVIENIIAAAMARAEAARLSNSPAELRAAIDHLEAALRDVRAQSAPCAAAAASTDPHAGHAMPGMQSPASTSPVTAPGVDPHAGHTTPSAAAAPKSGQPRTADSTTQSGEKPVDPVTGQMVDPATAPKATYQGKTYYFSSEQSRKEFLQNPAKFVKKPKG